jgi:peroxiredoxin
MNLEQFQVLEDTKGTLGSASEAHQRLKPGQQAPHVRATSISGQEVRVPDSKTEFTHIQFERFAGCPVCNLHLHDFIERNAELRAAGIREVVFFHSKSKFLNDQRQFPFDVLADAERVFYKQYRAESSPLAILSPKAWPDLVRGYRFKFSGIPDSSPFGQPADFLIGRDGKIIDCHYGTYASDQWSVDDVLKIAKARVNQ